MILNSISNINHKNNCMICGSELVYTNKTEKIPCSICGEEFESNVKCKNNHYVCDKCHSMNANDIIEEFCNETELTNPIEIALTLMKNPKIKMHGPEHHYLVPAALITSYLNIKGISKKEKKEKLLSARKRAEMIPGGFCGFCGNCGAGVGTGIFISIITDSTPLSKEEWKLANTMTAKSLYAIGELGGPRCCKRDTYTALIEATKFVEEQLHVKLFDYETDKIKCRYHNLNKECLEEKCPFFPR